MKSVIDRAALQMNISECLRREYIALLGQSGSDIQTFIETLVNGKPFVSGMKFVFLPLPSGLEKDDDFNELLLDRLIRAISNTPPERLLQNEVADEVEKYKRRSVDFRLRVALDTLGTKTAADPLVIILQSLATAPERPLRNLLLMLRDYHWQANIQGQPGKKLRFLAVGDLRLWMLCCSKMNDESPFNIAKRIFLNGFSYQELLKFDRLSDPEAAMHIRSLTGGVPSLVEKILELPEISNDLSPFFKQLGEHWNALPEASKQTLMRLASGDEALPICITDDQCQQIPWIESPWKEAFWKGFLSVENRMLRWHSLIHREFVLSRIQGREDISTPTLVTVDLRERARRLQKALKSARSEEYQDEYLEEALSLVLQIPGSTLAPILKRIQCGEEQSAIQESLRHIASNTDNRWIGDLEEKVANAQNSFTKLLIDAAAWETRRLQGDFDVFFCHNGEDKLLIKKIANQLLAHGILPWLDEWELRPGLPWQPILEQQLGRVKAATVFIGSKGLGPWQREELDILLGESHRRGCTLIPVILPNAPQETEVQKEKSIGIPAFLKNRTWVNFRVSNPNPIKQLIWGITGIHDYTPQ